MAGARAIFANVVPPSKTSGPAPLCVITVLPGPVV